MYLNKLRGDGSLSYTRWDIVWVFIINIYLQQVIAGQ